MYPTSYIPSSLFLRSKDIRNGDIMILNMTVGEKQGVQSPGKPGNVREFRCKEF